MNNKLLLGLVLMILLASTTTLAYIDQYLAVYIESSNNPKYVTYNGTVSSEINALDIGAVAHWVELATSPNLTTVIMATLDADSDVNVQTWDANSKNWSDLLEIETDGDVLSKGMDVIFESQSGDGLVVFGDGTNIPKYRIWNQTNLSWSGEESTGQDIGAVVKIVELCSDPTEDEIILVVEGSDADSHGVVWDGDTWGTADEIHTDGNYQDNVGHVSIGCAFESTSGEAIALGSDNDAGTLYYQTWTGSWSDQLTQGGVGDDSNQIDLASNPGSDEILLIIADHDGDTNFFSWSGTAWEDEGEVGGDILDLTSYPIGVAFEHNSLEGLFLYGDENNEDTPDYQTYTSGTIDGTNNGPDTGDNHHNALIRMVSKNDSSSDEILALDVDAGNDANLFLWDGSSLSSLGELSNNGVSRGDDLWRGDVAYSRKNVDNRTPRINASLNNSVPLLNDIVNLTANVTDNIGLDTCRFFMNGTSDGSFIILNKSVVNTEDQCSQNWTIDLGRGNVINFTVIVNDTDIDTPGGNINQSVNRSDGGAEVIGQLIEVANLIPTPTIVYPTNDFKTNLQPLDLNITYTADIDGDVINITYYIDSVLNQTQTELNTTFNASDGVYILNVTIFDNVTATSYSANVTVNFTIDTIKPNISLITPIDTFNFSSQNVTFSFNVTDKISTIDINCSINVDAILNSTNEATQNGTNTSFTIENFNEGWHNWNITCLDPAGNSNSSQQRNFSVDLTAPIIKKISFFPNTTDDVDQDVLLNFTVNVTDNVSAIKTAILQYKQSGAGAFTNSTMQYNVGSGLYNASFTPDIADTWSYRIYTLDHAGNNDSSLTQNISVENDRTWKRQPGTFTNLACGFSTTCEAGNLTINNTGDFTLNFDLSSNFGDTSYNITEPFDLVAKEVKVVNVSLTAGTSASENSVIITIDATTSNADPDSETTNFTFTESAGGPLFEVNIINPPTEANKSDPGVHHLNASLKNIGNETAGVTFINWTLPANWLNISGTNLTKNFTNVTTSETVYHNITVNLTSSASTGTQKVNVTAASNNSASDSATASIVVTETSTSTTTTTTTTSSGGGGGGGSGGGGGGGSIVRVPVEPEKIEISQNVDLVRGSENIFTINVTNTFNDSVMNNLTLKVTGFLSQYLSVNPPVISNLGFQQTKSFTVNVAAPTYKSYEEYTLQALVTGMIVKTEQSENVTITTKTLYSLKNFISLIVHETSKDDVTNALIDAEGVIANLQSSGIPVTKALKLLEEAEQNIDNRKYLPAKNLIDQIKNIGENAFSADFLIYEIKTKIRKSEDIGLLVEETKKLLNLALAAFEREDFSAAIQRAKDAELSIVIETKGKFNILKFVIDYWWPLLIVFILLSIAGYTARKKLALIVISRRLEDLQKEETTINELMQETQNKYYKDKKINTTEYHKAMYGYEKRLSEASQTVSRLRSKRVGIIQISNEIKNLEKESENVANLIKQLQDSYYNKQAVPRKTYLKRIKEYKTRTIEIEKSIAVMEAKLAKKEKLEDLEAKEATKKEIISRIKKKDRKFGKLPPIMPKSKFIGIKKNLAFIPKLTGKLNLKKLFSRGKHISAKAAPEKDGHSESVHELLDDLIKRKDKPKSIPPKSKESIQTLKNKLAIKELFQGKEKATEKIDQIKKKFSLKNLIKMPKVKISKKSINKSGEKRKEIISKIKNRFELDKIKPKARVKQYSDDAKSLKKHGFKVAEHKKPEPTYVMPKARTHTKHRIIRHFKEVYKNE
tara:strand:- start:11172 stop:16412 length:5241 start_codon:yes stop_codon:yes gene_type:complete